MKKTDYNSIASRLLPYAGIILTGFLLYFHVLYFGITYFDDHISITENRYFSGNIATNIFRAFNCDALSGQGGPPVYYRPLLAVSSILDTQFGGNVVFISHLTNIAIHLTAACLVFLLLTRLGYERLLSFVFSLIWTVHPVLVEAVAWIPGRTDSLLAVFVLAGFLFFLKFLDTKKITDYCFHLLFFALGIFTKETAFILPVICLLYVWLIFKRPPLIAFWIKILPVWWILTAGVWFFLRRAAFINPMRLEPFNAVISIWKNLIGVLLYLGKMGLPFNLSVLPTLNDSILNYGVMVLICAFVLILLSKSRRNNFIIFGCAWLVLFLLPGFARPNPDETISFMEYRAYLPLFGFIILLLETDLIKSLALKKIRLLLFAGAVISVFAAINFNYSKNFRDRMVFWKNAASNSPHFPLARRNLGAMYYLDGSLDEAEKEYLIALDLNPQEPMVYNNLGLIYMNRGRYEEAEAAFKKELLFNPGYDNAYSNLELLYARTGHLK